MAALKIKSISGGAGLKRELNKLAAKRSEHLRAGILENAKYPNEAATPVALVAHAHEFGVPEKNIPARPFMRLTTKNQQDAWRKDFAKLMQLHKGGGHTALNKLGQILKEDIQDGINSISEPPLKPATIKRKGHARVLQDTLHLHNSVDFEVKANATESE